MEREPQGGSDFGQDLRRDIGEEQPGALRDQAPDVLAPIDESAPVSGHVVAPPKPGASVADTPEHDWAAASKIIFPALRPVGTHGLTVADLTPEALQADSSRQHSQPLVDEGPCGIPVVYALHAGGFDVIVNGDHVLSWGVGARADPGRGDEEPRRLVGRRGLDRRGLRASGGCSRRTPATAGTRRGSCCRRWSTDCRASSGRSGGC